MTIRNPGVTICEYIRPGFGQPSDESGHWCASTCPTCKSLGITPRCDAASPSAVAMAGCESGTSLEPGRLLDTGVTDGGGGAGVAEAADAGACAGVPAFGPHALHARVTARSSAPRAARMVRTLAQPSATHRSTSLQPLRGRMLGMSVTRHCDIELHCTCCGEGFVYSAGEQELCAVRGVARVPRACPTCRKLLGR